MCTELSRIMENKLKQKKVEQSRIREGSSMGKGFSAISPAKRYGSNPNLTRRPKTMSERKYTRFG